MITAKLQVITRIWVDFVNIFMLKCIYPFTGKMNLNDRYTHNYYLKMPHANGGPVFVLLNESTEIARS